MSEPYVYKLLPWGEWETVRELGSWAGSAVDLADGFVHFSTWAQVAETARRHFAGQGELALVTVQTDALVLRWEPSRGGALFPHLYGELPLTSVVEAVRVPETEAGHTFPKRAPGPAS